MNQTQVKIGSVIRKEARTLVLWVSLGSVLVGCADFGLGSEEYSCSGIPHGVQCKSAREVYLARTGSKHEVVDELVEVTPSNELKASQEQNWAATKGASLMLLENERGSSFSEQAFSAEISIPQNRLNNSPLKAMTHDLRTFCAPADVMIMELKPYISTDGVRHSGETMALTLPSFGCRPIGGTRALQVVKKPSFTGEIYDVNEAGNEDKSKYLPVPYRKTAVDTLDKKRQR